MPTEEPPYTTDDDRAETIADALREVAGAIRDTAPKPSSDPRELGESYARGYAAGADEMRRTAARSIAKLMAYHLSGCVCDLCKEARSMWPTNSKPGPHVVGGPPPKPGERTEADYLREEVREQGAHIAEIKDWIADHDAGRQYPSVLTPVTAPPAQEEAAPKRSAHWHLEQVGFKFTGEAVRAHHAERERDELRAALKAEQAAHAETLATLDRHGRIIKNAQGHLATVALAEARATARREALEEAIAAVLSQEVERKGDPFWAGYNHAWLECTAALRALATPTTPEEAANA